MTDLDGGEGSLSAPEARAAVRKLAVRGFMALWRGERRPIAELTTDRLMVGAMSAAGRVEVDDGGILVGVHGLVATATAHRIVHAGGSVHTWCALDAVGVPAALSLDATAVTSCPACGARLHVDLQAGRPSADADLRLWLPGGPCSHQIEDFCRHANLYCNPEHLASTVGPDRVGQAIDVAEAASIGRTIWSDVAAIRRHLLADRL